MTRPTSARSALAPRSLTARLWPLYFAALTMFVTGCGPNLGERISSPRWGICGTLVIILDIIALVDLFRDPARDTTNKVIWALVIFFIPVLGCILYYVFARD